MDMTRGTAINSSVQKSHSFIFVWKLNWGRTEKWEHRRYYNKRRTLLETCSFLISQLFQNDSSYDNFIHFYTYQMLLFSLIPFAPNLISLQVSYLVIFPWYLRFYLSGFANTVKLFWRNEFMISWIVRYSLTLLEFYFFFLC